MRFILADGSRAREVHGVVHDPEATVADLVEALDPAAPAGAGLVVGTTRVPGDRRLDRSGLLDGTTVAVAGSRPVEAPAVAEPEPGRPGLAVSGGLCAGERVDLPPVGLVVGRDPEDEPALRIDDPALSRRHALLCGGDGEASLAVTDLGSHNGTWLDGTAVTGATAVPAGAAVRLGATQIRPEPHFRPDGVTLPPGRFATGSTIPFNRPPRSLPVDDRPPLAAPEKPDPPAPSTAVGVVAVVVPVVMALAMMKLFGNPIYGLFALLGPMLLVGGAVEGRRRRKRTSRRQEQRFGVELERFGEELAAAGAVEARRLDTRLADPAEVVRRATHASTHLWERRPAHDDFLRLRAGTGPVPWSPPVTGDRASLAEAVRSAIDAAGTLPGAPVEVDLSGSGVVGIAGDRSAGLAVARCLVLQAAVHHGPADLVAAVLTSPEGAADWEWAGWLPHCADPEGAGDRLLLTTAEAADDLLGPRVEQQPEGTDEWPVLCLVIDGDAHLTARRSLVRSALRGAAGPVAALVLAPSVDQLPASCTTIIELTDPLGTCAVHHPAAGTSIGPGLAAGVTEATASRTARALARFDDPDAVTRAGAGLPATARLPGTGIHELDVGAVARRWTDAGPDPSLVVPLGVGADGDVAVDLVADGPHALVAGTTGSGKSELLRTLVAGLALAASPEHLSFVLIDFKGGSAFDRCADLPHTVGVVTDLDDALARRALRSLEAELRHRERLLRDARADDLTAYRAGPPSAPVPRLVVVIDEFATLAAELPDFVDRLLAVAQRGRSLGVHLVLATQRPAGAVSDHIRANTNLRIALRVQDPAESSDVVGVPDAASLPRRQPGRAVARLGHGEVVTLQAALVTGITPAEGRPPVEILPEPALEVGGGAATRSGPARAPAPAGPTDLDRLVAAARDAFTRSDAAEPRRPWLPPLAGRVDLSACDRAGEGDRSGRATAFGEPGAAVDFCLVDDPDRQDQRPGGWVPADGNLLLVGITGSGTTTALGSLALSAVAGTGPDRLHLYVLDHGAGDLAPLAGLPHTGAHIGTAERERQERLVRFLRKQLDRRAARSSSRSTEPRLLVLVDNIAGLRHAWPDAGPSPLVEELTRVLVDGPEVGIHAVLAADRAAAVPPALLASLHQKLLFRPADPSDHAAFGVPAASLPTYRPGTAVRAHDGLTVQVGVPAQGLAAAVAGLDGGDAPPSPRPEPIGALPAKVRVKSVAQHAEVGGSPWFLPLGIGELDLSVVGLALHQGDHAMVAGPPRSGRTTALLTLAEVAAAAGATVLAVTDGARSPLSAARSVTAVEPCELAGRCLDGPVLVLVDDAERVDDANLADLVAERRPGWHLVAAGRSDALRSGYDHWTRAVRASRVGVLLDPDPDLDGDLLGTRLPRLAPVGFSAGRGWLTGVGPLEVVQIAETSLDMK